eukprot:Platyproteum_vivax@DN4915_c0_g1_i1.p1
MQTAELIKCGASTAIWQVLGQQYTTAQYVARRLFLSPNSPNRNGYSIVFPALLSLEIVFLALFFLISLKFADNLHLTEPPNIETINSGIIESSILEACEIKDSWLPAVVATLLSFVAGALINSKMVSSIYAIL